MKPAQLVPTTLPALLQACQDAETNSHDEEGSEVDHPQAAYTLLTFPSPLCHNPSHVAYIVQNQNLQEFTERAKAQMEADYASQKLMDAENSWLQAQLFGKKTVPKKWEGGSGAQYMMSTEMMEAVAKVDWEDHNAAVHHEATAQFRAIKSAIKEQDKVEKEEKRCTKWDAQAAAKAAVRDALKAKKAAFTLAVKSIGQAQRDLASGEKAKAVALKKATTEAKHAAAPEKRFQKEQEQIVAMDAKAEKA